MSNNTTIQTMQNRLHDIAQKGAYHSEIYTTSSSGHRIHLEDSKVADISSFGSDGTGARIIIGDATFFSNAPGADGANAAYALSKSQANAGIELPDLHCAGEQLIEPDPGLPSLSSDILSDVDKIIRSASKYVKQVSVGYRSSSRQTLILASDGRIARDKQTFTGFTVHIVVEKDGDLRTGYAASSATVPIDEFWSARKPQDIADEALRRALLQLEARPCPAAVMPVLVSGKAGGTLIHEACGHGLEADIILKDYSTFKDKIGCKVASELVTMIDDATIPGYYGSYKYDDEGNAARRSVLIENGILKRYMTDILSARQGDFEITGNGRRESYMCAPQPRMSNTFLAPGLGDEDEMLQKMGSGLYVCKMGGGEVNPTTGDFVFHVSEGYRVEKGKIAYPVRGATLTGNGPKALLDILEVGKSVHFDPGTCGKGGQGVPVTDGQPAILVSSLLVGGSDTGDD